MIPMSTHDLSCVFFVSVLVFPRICETGTGLMNVLDAVSWPFTVSVWYFFVSITDVSRFGLGSLTPTEGTCWSANGRWSYVGTFSCCSLNLIGELDSVGKAQVNARKVQNTN